MRAILILIAAYALGLATAQGDEDHGVWFWGSTTLSDGSTSPFGSARVVGDAAREDECIAFFTYYGVKRVYGSYQNRPVTEPGVIATWNGKLDDAGIESQLLIDGDAVNDPGHVSNLLKKVTNRLITFNANRGTNVHQRFDALHLDLEPQRLSLWDSGSTAVKRGLLNDLLDAYEDVRNLLDVSGNTSMPVYADIPFFWDKLPEDGGSIGWANAADRDAWYGDLSVPLRGLSIMTFSKDNVAALAAATVYERTGAFAHPARIAIQGKVGPGKVWTNFTTFADTLSQLDDAFGPAESTDIENLGHWRYSLSTYGPMLTDAPVLSMGGDPTGGIDLLFAGAPGNGYTVNTSTNLVQWRDGVRLQTDSTQDVEVLRVPVSISDAYRFYRIGQENVPR